MTDEQKPPPSQSSLRREDQQLSNIATPHAHDVLMGRGNGAKDHIGNKQFRAMVDDHLSEYVACPKPNRGRYATIVIDQLRALDPPARFLKFDKETGVWSDIGDDKTLRKVRQRFREKTPELEKCKKKKDGGTVAATAATAASGKGKKSPPAEVAQDASSVVPILVPEACFSQVPAAAGVDECDDDSVEYYDEYDDYYDDDEDQFQESLDNLEPLPIEQDTIGPIDILHASCPENPQLHGSLIRRNGALNLSAEEDTRNFIQRQHGSLDLSTEMKLMRSDPHRGKRESLIVEEEEEEDGSSGGSGGLTIHRQSGNLDVTAAASAAASTPGMAEAVLAAQAEVRGNASEGGESQQHVVSTVPLNDQNNAADRTHMMKDRSRSGRRTKFSRVTSGGSSGTMTISDQTINSAGGLSTDDNLASVFEESALPDGFVEEGGEEQQRPKEKQLADSMKKFSDMSLDDDGDATRTLEGEKKFSNMSLDDDGGIAPTPLKDIINKEGENKPGSNISLTLSRAVEYLGDSVFSTLAEGDGGGNAVSNKTAQKDHLPPNITLNEAKTFSEMSLDDGTAVSPSAAAAAAASQPAATELAPTKLPSDFSLSLSQTGSFLGDSTFSNTSLAIVEGEREG